MRKRILVTAAVGIGIALRVWVYRSVLGAPDSDEAVVGLMARHALHGELTVFFWGQVYGGSQEALLAAPFVGIFGTTLFAIRIVPIALHAIACVLLWRVGRRLFGDTAGLACGLVFWIWPPYQLVHGTPAYGFYGTNVFYVSLLLLLALRFVDEPSAVRIALFGLVLGLAYWQTAQVIPVVLPVIAWMLWRRRDAWRVVWAGVVAVVVGALPWIVWNLTHNGGSVLTRSDVSAYVHGLRLFASPLLPMLLGLRAPLAGTALLPKLLYWLVYVGVLAAVAVGAWRARHTKASVVYVVAVCFPFIWTISHRVTILTSHPVYLLVFGPIVALLLGQLGTTPLRAAVLVLVVAAVAVVTFHRMEANLTATNDEHWPPPTPRSLAPLERTLARYHVTRAYGDYWIAYRLSYDTSEHVIATYDQWLHWRTADGVVTPVPETVRYEPYQRKVEAARDHAFVFFRKRYEPTPIRGALLRNAY
ncbi:MAG: glycosyltransferase family 39 protein, partial [Actinomycetota bacterium]